MTYHDIIDIVPYQLPCREKKRGTESLDVIRPQAKQATHFEGHREQGRDV